MNNNLPLLVVDRNWLNKNNDPIITKQQVKDLNLNEGQKVIAIEDDNQWEATLMYDSTLPHQEQWYIILDWSTWNESDFRNIIPFEKMSEKEATEHLDWFLNKYESSMLTLKNTYKFTNGSGELDFSPKSLINLWDWTLEISKINEKNNSYINPIIKKQNTDLITNYTVWAYKLIGEDDVSLNGGMIETIRLVGMYFGEVCTKDNPSVKWEVGNDSKPILSRKLSGGVVMFLNPFSIIYSELKNKVDLNKNNLYEIYTMLFEKKPNINNIIRKFWLEGPLR
ncbi:hypothetical protein A8F94_05455 [Bacillus sp. FJAT-27225]|uniref:hypothetical protein n=1 Tax=Bacillus sp. FJAT-27225 TaxID=1743144 RepID=UPI00080C28FE|nr:hypothetical protein [Bacillus sp. FJAT-27225]OCA91307.1 hypothetical protein A8F94_05455 [Bacillus sp. FJAT-27225]